MIEFLALLLVPVAIVAAFVWYQRYVVWPADPTKDKSWDIGPTIGGSNRSVGMPKHPTGLAFDFPHPDVTAGHVHYVTFVHGSLRGKGQLRLRYRIDTAEGVQFVSRNGDDTAGGPATICLYFQRRGDTWGARGKYETFRWYATFAFRHLERGEHELIADLDDPRWTALQTSTAASNPEGFADAKSGAERVGFVIGGGDGWGHGAWATGPARFTILEFST